MKQHWLKTEDGEQFSPNVYINSLYTDEDGNSPFLPQYNQKIQELETSKITTERIKDNAVTNDKLKDNTITNDKLKDNTISFDKLDEDLQEKINKGGGGGEGGPAFGIIQLPPEQVNHQIEEKCWDTIANMPINSNKELYNKYSKLFSEIHPYYEIFMIIEDKNDNNRCQVWVIDKDYPIESSGYNFYFESTIYPKESGYPSPYSKIQYLPYDIYSEERKTNLYYVRKFDKNDVENLTKDKNGTGYCGDMVFITPPDNYNIYLYTNGLLDSQNIHIMVIDQYNASSEPAIIYNRTYSFNRADNNKIINTETEEIVYYTSQESSSNKIEADKATDTLVLTSDGQIGVELDAENKQINFSLLADIPEPTQVKVSDTRLDGSLLGTIQTSNGIGGQIRIPNQYCYFGEGKFTCSSSIPEIVEKYNKFLSYFKESYNIRYDFLDMIDYAPYLIFETDNEDIYTIICDTKGSMSLGSPTNLYIYKLTEETFNLASDAKTKYIYTINKKTKEIIYKGFAARDVVLKGHFYNITYYNYGLYSANCLFYDENDEQCSIQIVQHSPSSMSVSTSEHQSLSDIVDVEYGTNVPFTAVPKKIIIDSPDLDVSYKKLSSTYDIERLSLSLKEKGGGSGDKVTVTQTVTSGDELAKISVNGNETSILMPTPQEVDIATTEKVGVVKPDGTTITITEDGIISSTGGGSGSEVSIAQILTEGTEIAKITIDGQDTSLYAPEGGDNQEIINARTNAEGTTYENLKARLDDADSEVAAIDKDWIDSIKDNLSIDENGNINIITDKGKKFTYNGTEVSAYYELTKAEYDALPDTKLTDGVKYFITDYSESSSIDEVKLSSEGSSNQAIRFGVDENGNYGYYKVGADTVTPFKAGGEPVNLFIWDEDRCTVDDHSIKIDKDIYFYIDVNYHYLAQNPPYNYGVGNLDFSSYPYADFESFEMVNTTDVQFVFSSGWMSVTKISANANFTIYGHAKLK